ncbi:hypothetical protein LshimejAT787_1201740 [Lyophyllum shimeji]|uniref:Uncharacterized protein n=1 Tax=Lyophyllum shimeji TaxID=47721 RepID=A0A9P3PVD7_LYOSH|nr:hypothetical protein LshimejAT787_1201740 [Lyophyllum shimeji]
MIRDYYQVGGFQPHIILPNSFRYDDKKLSEFIVGDASPLRPKRNGYGGPIELILGIKPTGSSHLLLSEPQMRAIVQTFRLQYPRPPFATSPKFESLSPIYFHSVDEFATKLSFLKPKAAKNRTPTDNSQANKQFAMGDEGIQRGAFEHGRLLYHILQDPHFDLEKYSLSDASWTSSLLVYSFVFNTRADDTRHSSVRRTHPIVLDCGISQATIPELHLQGGTSKHLYFTNNKFMNAGGKKLAFQHDTTEELDGMVISARLKAFFEDYKNSRAGPMILLVHDEELSLNMLKNCGVDTTSWELGIKHLLGFGTSELRREPSPSRSYDPRRQHPGRRDSRREYDDRRTRPRERSRSPSRSSNPTPYPSSSRPPVDQRSSHRSPPPRLSGSSGGLPEHRQRTYAPVYVVDIQQQFKKLMQTATSSESVTKISQYLGLFDADGWNAGNESVMIIDVWRSMVSGPAIDEQRAFWNRKRDPGSRAPQAPPPTEAGALDYDSDRDPNEIRQETQQEVHDDDSDWGQSSDDDD